MLLQYLNVADNSLIDSQSLHALADNCRHLTSINLRDCHHLYFKRPQVRVELSFKLLSLQEEKQDAFVFLWVVLIEQYNTTASSCVITVLHPLVFFIY